MVGTRLVRVGVLGLFSSLFFPKFKSQSWILCPGRAAHLWINIAAFWSQANHRASVSLSVKVSCGLHLQRRGTVRGGGRTLQIEGLFRGPM